MTELIRKVCLYSILCAVVEMISIDERTIKAIRIINTAVISVMIISCITEVDLSAFSLSTAQIHSSAAELTSDAAETMDRLRRMVIEKETEEYIYKRAEEMGIELRSVQAAAEWSGEYWLPYKVEIYCDTENADMLRNMIQSELGIGEERQVWHFEG